jgi:hypothetical protein
MGAVPTTLSGYLGAGGEAVTNWLASFFNDGRLSATANFSGISSAQIDAAYLLDTQFAGTPADPDPVAVEFGIKSFGMASPTVITVTCRLKTNGTLKDGAIRGKIRLLGRTAWPGSPWTPLDGMTTPNPADFVGGLATYTFTVPGGGYKYFHPQIVP